MSQITNLTDPSSLIPLSVQEGAEILNSSPGHQDSHTINQVPTTRAGSTSVHSLAVTSPSSPSSVATEPGQTIEEFTASIEETKKLATVLEGVFKIAPTMALLRALDINGGSPESIKLFESNRGLDLGEKKLILNNRTPPVRIAIPVPGEENKWTSIVPSIIPAGITTMVPDSSEQGQWIKMKAPNREPENGENQQVRALLQEALGLYYGEATAKEKLPQSKTQDDVTISSVSSMIQGIHEMEPQATTDGLIVPGGDQKSLQQADQIINSPYASLLEGIAAAAEIPFRAAGVVAGASVETLKNVAKETGESMVDNVKFGYENFGLLVPMVAMPIAFTASLEGIIMAGIKLPDAIQSSLKYFAPQQALEKSIEAFSQVGSTAFSNFETQSKLFEQLKNVNEADQNLKNSITEAFQPFNGIPKYQQMQHTLTEPIDQRIAKRTELMEGLHAKIQATKTSGPWTRGKQLRVDIRKRKR